MTLSWNGQIGSRLQRLSVSGLVASVSLRLAGGTVWTAGVLDVSSTVNGAWIVSAGEPSSSVPLSSTAQLPATGNGVPST